MSGSYKTAATAAVHLSEAIVRMGVLPSQAAAQTGSQRALRARQAVQEYSAQSESKAGQAAGETLPEAVQTVENAQEFVLRVFLFTFSTESSSRI